MTELESMTLKEYTFLATVVGGGKITIPLEVRKILKIEDGKQVEATVRLIDEDGRS